MFVRLWKCVKRLNPPTVLIVALIAGAVLVYMIVAWRDAPGAALKATGAPARSAGEYGDQFGAANALFSGFAMVIASAAILIQIIELREQRITMRESADATAELARLDHTQQLLLMYRHFGSKRFSKVRDRCWRAWDDFLDSNSGYREFLIERFRVETSAQHSENLVTEEDKKRGFDKQHTATWRLLEFFNTLYVCTRSDKRPGNITRQLGFYFGWWHGFLLEMRDAYKEANPYIESDAEEDKKRREQLPPPGWYTNLDAMADHWGVAKYDQATHPADVHRKTA